MRDRPDEESLYTNSIPIYPCYRGLADSPSAGHDFVVVPGGRIECRYCGTERKVESS